MALTPKYLFLPEYWFFGIDSLFEFAFFLITATICYYGYQAYKLTSKQGPKDFFTGFALISLSYFVKSVTNFIIHFQINKGNFSQEITLTSKLWFAWGYYLHLLFILAGLVFLSYVALKNPPRRTRWLVAALVLALSLQSFEKMTNFYMSAFILIGVLIYHYGTLYYKKKDKCNLLVLLGFCSLFIGQLLFFLVEKHILFYVTGHILELIGFGLLLMNLMLVMWFIKK